MSEFDLLVEYYYFCTYTDFHSIDDAVSMAMAALSDNEM